jgi:UDP-glucose 4-epimerase
VNDGGDFTVREFPADRKRIDIGDYYADDAMIRTELGWSPTTPLEQGLQKSLSYYRANIQHYL